MSKARRPLPADHTPDYPVPLEHRGPDTLTGFADHGILYLIDEENAARAWLTYDGPLSEVVL